jgi:hypothetical protein
VGLKQLVAVEQLVKKLVGGSPLVGKVALDLLIQTMDEEVVTVSWYCRPTWSLAKAHPAPKNLLMQSSLSSR